MKRFHIVGKATQTCNSTKSYKSIEHVAEILIETMCEVESIESRYTFSEPLAFVIEQWLFFFVMLQMTDYQ